MSELCFVLSSGQNRFFAELVEALCRELDALGVATSTSTDGFPTPREGLAYALVPPHEYVALEGSQALPGHELLERTIYICAEQPDSIHFDQNTQLARAHPPGALFDINPRAVTLFRKRDLPARHLPLGYTTSWDGFDAAPTRDIDITFLGAQTQHRFEALRGAAPVLARRRCELRISDNSRPNIGPSATFLVGDAKRDLLSRSRVLLNIHQTDEPYFEWLRIIEAIHCGAAVVSEHSTDFAPLVPGEHFLCGRAETLGYLADMLLQNEPRRRAMARAAYELLRQTMPLSAGARALATAATELATRPLAAPESDREPRFSRTPTEEGSPAPAPHVYAEASSPEQSIIRRNLSKLRLDTIELSRRLTRIEMTERSPDRTPPPRVRIVASAAAWRAARPRVTVVVPLYNQSAYVVDALESVASSRRFRQAEIVVVDDASSDHGSQVVGEFIGRHPDIATLLVLHPINRGLPHARNTGIAFARGRYCMMLDADNALYPRCLARLADTLDAEPELAFAYCQLECFGQVEGYLQRGGMPIINPLAWEPERLRHGNFIDAMSMIRRDVLLKVGGYASDSRLYGFEDWDLWCTLAERGYTGRHVAEILGRYRTSASSMSGLMDLSVTDSVTAVVERHPRLMAGVRIPA